MKAKNRNVCGTLVTQLFQNSVGFNSDDFYHSFNKAMDGTCDVGTVDGEQKGTTSPNASQYRYKIANCGGTGPIQFTRRDTIGFGGCTQHGECQRACPKGIGIDTIARMSRDQLLSIVNRRS